MPRTQALPDLQVDHLSILDEDGNLDEELEPEITDQQLLEGFRAMLKACRFDGRRLELQRTCEIGTLAPFNAQEAAQIGVVSALLAKGPFCEQWSDRLLPQSRT